MAIPRSGAREVEFAGRDLTGDYVESGNAEVAVWAGEGGMIDIDGDSVIGWVSPAGVLDALAAAEFGNEDGIRAALISGAP